MEITCMGGPGESSDGLWDPDDEHMRFIPTDTGGRGRPTKNKQATERGSDRKDRHPCP